MTGDVDYTGATDDERQGIDWWNAQSDDARRKWIAYVSRRTGSAFVSALDVWTHIKRLRADWRREIIGGFRP